jgi:hypothetical protein
MLSPRVPVGRIILGTGSGDKEGAPLTARVTANRLWSPFFGRGLVATPDDFGAQGARPTHPDLLDRLASDFVDGGWDVKRLVRQILASGTYRVHVHDLHATILRLFGIDHTRLTYGFQGRDFRLTDVAGKVVDPILA